MVSLLTLHRDPPPPQFWQSRNIRGHLNGVNCAVLSVGGWYDAEDPLGALIPCAGLSALDCGRCADWVIALLHTCRVGPCRRWIIIMPPMRRALLDLL